MKLPLKRQLTPFSLSHGYANTPDAGKLLRESACRFPLYGDRAPLMRRDKLPKTFGDVIEITTRLGFRHLWIDSLFIVRDSIEDWRKEAANMHHVRESPLQYCCYWSYLGTEAMSASFPKPEHLQSNHHQTWLEKWSRARHSPLYSPLRDFGGQ